MKPPINTSDFKAKLPDDCFSKLQSLEKAIAEKNLKALCVAIDSIEALKPVRPDFSGTTKDQRKCAFKEMKLQEKSHRITKTITRLLLNQNYFVVKTTYGFTTNRDGSVELTRMRELRHRKPNNISNPDNNVRHESSGKADPARLRKSLGHREHFDTFDEGRSVWTLPSNWKTST